MNRLRTPSLFFLVGLGIFAVLAGLSERVDPVYAEMRALWKAVERDGPTAEALFIGNSHSRALHGPSLGVEAVHLWRGGGDLFEALYLARRARSHMPRLRYVFVSASFPILEMDNAAATEEDLSGRRVEIYARVPGWPPLPGDAQSFVRGKASPVVRPDHWGRIFRPGLRREEEDTEAARPRRGVDLREHAAMRVERARRRTADMRQGHPGLASDVKAELERFAREMAAAKVEVVLYTPPFHPAYTARYDTAAANRLRLAMRRLAAEHENVVYLDASRDTTITAREEYFLNSDHLNEEGARAFSAALRGRLAEQQVLD